MLGWRLGLMGVAHGDPGAAFAQRVKRLRADLPGNRCSMYSCSLLRPVPRVKYALGSKICMYPAASPVYFLEGFMRVVFTGNARLVNVGGHVACKQH
jgi:hypothetical protein